jgi:hypothetical protein
METPGLITMLGNGAIELLLSEFLSRQNGVILSSEWRPGLQFLLSPI